MFFSNYTHELMKELESKDLENNRKYIETERSFLEEENKEKEYYDDIFKNWVDKVLGIDFYDACDAKDSGMWTSCQFKHWVSQYKALGGGNEFMKYAFDRYSPREAFILSDINMIG